MKFTKLELNGAFLIELEKLEDERGFFARTFDSKEFEKNGLESKIIQCNTSETKKKGTIRGLHYQITPYEEIKLVKCTRGIIFDVIIDLNKESETFGKWFGTTISAFDHKMIYVPKGFAHGFQSIEDNTEVFYQNSEIHMAKFERGIRWDDPFFNIEWFVKEKIISPKDQSWKNFKLV